MAFPANLTTVTVVGSFITPEGTPSTGTVTFTASSWLTNSGANLSIPNSAVTKTLGTAGNFTATIPITDDADISPTGWVYTVAEVVDGVSRSYDVTIPGTVVAGGTVFLADLTPAAAAGPEYYSLASSLSIGTVSTLAAGSAATATITGLAPNQTLNLGIPTGATGPAASLGTVTPQALATAAAGTSLTASREDHVHSSTVANPTFTGQVIVPAGSASAPAIAPTGDTNNGVFFPAADVTAIATNGSERVRVDSSGLVGIGISPAANINLHVEGDTTRNVRLAQNSTDATGFTVQLVKRRGTGASPTVVSSGDELGKFIFYGHDGTTLRSGAGIYAYVDADAGSADMPGRLSFLTSADGSASLVERQRIDSNGLVTGTGTSLGAWTAYTPTLGGTGWDIGNGTIGGAYCQLGKIVHFWLRLRFSTTSTFGNAALLLTLPTAAPSGNANETQFRCFESAARDHSAGNEYALAAVPASTTQISMQYLSTSGQKLATSSTAPFTWADTDYIWVNGTYTAA